MTSGFESIPANWKISRLNWVASVNARIGWKALTAAEYQSDGYAFLSTPNIKSRDIDFTNVNHISEFRYLESPELQLAEGDVLLTKDGFTLGTVNIVRNLPRPATVNGSIAVLRPFDIHPGFLYYVIASSAIQEHIWSVKDGMDVLHLFQRDIKKFPILLPPLEEQRRIADFLDVNTTRIDELIRKFGQQRDLLAERERTVRPLTVSGARLGEGRIPTQIPWLPFMHPEAQLLPLIRLLQLQRGVDLSEGQRRIGKVPVITTAGPSGWHDTAIASGPGVVIGRYGSIGNVHWVETPYWPHNTTLYVKNFNDNYPRYCFHVLRSLPYEMEQARAAVPGVNRNDLHRQLIALLPRSLQGRVAQQLDSEMKRMATVHEQIRRAETLLLERRHALISAAVTGQFDVTSASGRGVTE